MLVAYQNLKNNEQTKTFEVKSWDMTYFAQNLCGEGAKIGFYSDTKGLGFYSDPKDLSELIFVKNDDRANLLGRKLGKIIDESISQNKEIKELHITDSGVVNIDVKAVWA